MITPFRTDLSLLSVAAPIIWDYLRKKQLKSAELTELQNKKLRALIRHSYKYVPYYNSLLKQTNLTPDDIKTVDDLHKIPPTTKKDIIDLPPEKIGDANIDPKKCWV